MSPLLAAIFQQTAVVHSHKSLYFGYSHLYLGLLSGPSISVFRMERSVYEILGSHGYDYDDYE
jgi:hypothetical protein